MNRILPLTLKCVRLQTGIFKQLNNSSRNVSTFLDAEKRRLVIDSEPNSVKEEYPWVWLRDNCQCSSCYEPLAQSRILNLLEFDQKLKPVNCQVKNGRVEVEWEDKHQSVYDYSWLMQRSFRTEQRNKFSQSVNTKSVYWSEDFGKNYPRADFNSIMTDDSALLSWLDDLDRHGFVLLQNVPIKEGPVHHLQARSGFSRMTHYGQDYVVKIKDDPSNLAYTHHRIFFHTDSPFYEHMPGVAYLHCIEQHKGEGGETMLADGFKAAAILKERDPEKHRLLSTQGAYFKDIGDDYVKFNSIAHHPPLVHDSRGHLVKVNWNHFTRDSYFDVDIDQVEDFYSAMRSFDDILNAPENHIRLKMQPGDMVTTKNLRVLHGRSELKGGVSGRHLHCGYVDWDEIRSTMRVLREKLH